MADGKTLNFLLNQERKEILNYFSKNMQQILLGIQKIDKICGTNCGDDDVSEIKVHPIQTCTNMISEKFPTSHKNPVGRFPSFDIYQTRSNTSTYPNSEISNDE